MLIAMTGLQGFIVATSIKEAGKYSDMNRKVDQGRGSRWRSNRKWSNERAYRDFAVDDFVAVKAPKINKDQVEDAQQFNLNRLFSLDFNKLP
jgi:hypothetical protein